MVKTWIKSVVSYSCNLELMYFQRGNTSIFVLYIIYRKAMLDSLHFGGPTEIDWRGFKRWEKHVARVETLY